MISDIRLGECEESSFVKTRRMHYTQKGVQKSWDMVDVHDSVSILIYHKEKNAFVLVKQFRPPVYLQNSDGYTYELCAGIVDKESSLEQIAKEEIDEECEEINTQEEVPFNFTDLVLLWFFSGIPALIAGYFVAGMCAGGAILVNVLHNLSPKFVFVMPLIVVAFMALTPAMFGVGVGSAVGYMAHLLNFRNIGSAFLVGLFWGVTGLACFPWLADLGTPPGTEFFDDILMPFVELMVGASLNFEWLAEPKPAQVPPWIVRSVFWGSGILGVLVACGNSVDIVEDRLDS